MTNFEFYKCYFKIEFYYFKIIKSDVYWPKIFNKNLHL